MVPVTKYLASSGRCGQSECMTDHTHHHDEGSALSDTALRVRALETLLVEKGYVDPEALDQLIDTYETKLDRATGLRWLPKLGLTKAIVTDC